MLQVPPEPKLLDESAVVDSTEPSIEMTTAFSLERFIPLLKERIYVQNPFTRTFLVSWVTLLDSIPDLELVSYLPAFLGGLFKFLSDPNRDVHVATQGALERFLSEIKKIAKIKRGIAESRRSGKDGIKAKPSNSSDTISLATDPSDGNEKSVVEDGTIEDEQATVDDDWIPGQDIQVDHPKILKILVDFLDPASGNEDEIRLTALRWIDSFFEISPEDILAFIPRLLSQVLPAMASEVDQVRQAANRVNNSLMDYIASFPDEPEPKDIKPATLSRVTTATLKDANNRSRPASSANIRPTQSPDQDTDEKKDDEFDTSIPPSPSILTPPKASTELDYESAIGTLTLHFLNEHEATRVAALAWLIMLHRKAPRKVLATNEGTFPALLKTLSDPSEAVVTRDLQLLSQISKNSEDSYFTSFMASLLQLFCTDRRLLETRGNLIIRQLCLSLSPERIYRTLAETLEKDEDVEFASIMVQNLNNNLITAPELSELRKRLRNIDHRDGQSFFVTLFRTWCHNAVATFSLCLLAQAYEQAYNLLQVFAELEMTVVMLIQIDKLVQLLESPVFTYLRLQLLEPDKYPYLYKCLYGVLMLLPQSSAFAALKNRLNSVSAIGYLHVPPRV
jgi:vacuole morphology and inheritance protein 14